MADGIEHVEYVAVPMRDGTALAASVTRPASGGPFPTILTRTPYDRTNQRAAGEMWADAGYAFVRQDVRGRFDSHGEFWPFRDDPADGYDTIEWLAAQPWCDGRIGMTGASHVGTVQYLVAPEWPPHLAAAIPEFAPASVDRYWWYQGGAFRLSFNAAWVALLAQDNTRHVPARAAALEADRRGLWRTPEQMRSLDLGRAFPGWTPAGFRSVEGVFGNDWFERFMAHPQGAAFWSAFDFALQHAEMDVPMLHIGGWHDTFQQGTIDSFLGMQRHAPSEAARRAQRLIMGPWRHVSWGAREVGELDFGEALMEVLPFDVRRQWFDHWLRGIDTGLLDEPPVLIFVMGANEWRREATWPPPDAVEVPYYLHAEGTLSRDPPATVEAPREYEYDPADPVPTIGGPEWVNFPSGPFDQAPLDGRADVLRFETPPLVADLEVTGQVFARLLVSSSATDTDFTAKLIDVWPDGRAFNVCDGILRARYREGFDREVSIAPGEPSEVTIDLWSTSNVFKAGHRIRLDVSSSNFPRFDANPNTGAPLFAPGGRTVARNAVHFEPGRPSRVMLPVVAR